MPASIKCKREASIYKWFEIQFADDVVIVIQLVFWRECMVTLKWMHFLGNDNKIYSRTQFSFEI